MSASQASRVLDYLHRQRPAMVELLQRLALAESPSDDPYAVGLALNILVAELESAGLLVRRARGRTSGGTLLARPREKGKGRPLQLLLGHCDTVWPVGTLRQMPVRIE